MMVTCLVLAKVTLHGLVYAGVYADGDSATCEDLLDSAMQGFDDGGTEGLATTIAGQYTEYPSGAYVYCYNNITEGQTNALGTVRFIHPYLPLGESVGMAVAGKSQEEQDVADADHQTPAMKAIDMCCGNIFNFSMAFSQATSENLGEYVESSTRREYLGFGEELPDGSYFYCACPTTNIPEGLRNNSNVALLTGSEEPAAAPSSSAVSLLVSPVVMLLVVSFVFNHHIY